MLRGERRDGTEHRPGHGRGVHRRRRHPAAPGRHRPDVLPIHHDIHQRPVPGHRVHLARNPRRLRRLQEERPSRRVHGRRHRDLHVRHRSRRRVSLLARWRVDDRRERIAGCVRGVLQLVFAVNGGRIKGS